MLPTLLCEILSGTTGSIIGSRAAGIAYGTTKKMDATDKREAIA